MKGVDNEQVGLRASFRGMVERFRRVVVAQLLATFGVLLLALTIIGLPWAVWKYVSRRPRVRSARGSAQPTA